MSASQVLTKLTHDFYAYAQTENQHSAYTLAFILDIAGDK